MVTAGTIEELLGEPLAEARRELSSAFNTPAELWRHRNDALALPKVAAFRVKLEDYILRAEEIADRLVGDDGIILQAFARANTETRHAWQVHGLCYEHPVPKVVAIASLSTSETDKFTSVEAALENMRFTHADMTHSYHTESIDKQGRVICREHSQPVSWVVSAKVHRLVPKPKLKPAAIENTIIGELAQRFYNNNGTNGKGERIRTEIRQNLEVLLRVGQGGIYSSIYEALEQTAHRAITAAHIAKNADLDKLTQTFRDLIGCNSQTRTLPPQARAHHLKETAVFKAISDLAAKHIPAPLVVTSKRTKGQTLVDKVTVREHYGQLIDASDQRKLQRHYTQLGFRKLGIPIPDGIGRAPPNIDDVVGVQALTHSDDDYDMSDLTSTRYQATPKQIAEGMEKAHHILGVLAELPQNLRGYERENRTRANGKKQRMPPDKHRPRFRALGVRTTSNGLTIDLVPSPNGTFDDYFIAPKRSGYMAIHMAVGTTDRDLAGAVIEMQIKPNYVDNLEMHSQDERHDMYKIIRAAQINYLRKTGLVSGMEWAMNTMLLTPSGRNYVETGLVKTNGNGKNHAHK